MPQPPTTDHRLAIDVRRIAKKILKTGDYLNGYKRILCVVERHGYIKLE